MPQTKLVLKIFYKGECAVCSLDEVSRFIRDIQTLAREIYHLDIQTYSIDTPEGLAEAAFERVATASMPILLIRDEGKEED
jgi:hypothetical protein